MNANIVTKELWLNKKKCRQILSAFFACLQFSQKIVVNIVEIDFVLCYNIIYKYAFKATPHNHCRADAKSDFSSDCIETTQAY